MPVALAPLLVPIEILSYLSRIISLSVRLFANMMAGHVMLEVFGAFVVMLGSAGLIGYFPAAFALAVNVALIGFECWSPRCRPTCSRSSPASTCTTRCICTDRLAFPPDTRYLGANTQGTGLHGSRFRKGNSAPASP